MDDPSVVGSILRRIRLDFPAGRVLAAVSGGADSLALLRVLVESGRDVVAAHVNHQMRGLESEADESHVRDLCAALGVDFDSRRVQVLGESSIEAQARSLRYAALEDVARIHDCACIATGHTANDNLETILLHWLRGATVSGMSGIPASRLLRAGSQVLVVRPLLDVARSECEAICIEAGWTWREDSSNANAKYLRNRVRRELVPLLENLMAAPQAAARPRERMARQATRAARLWADDLDLLDALAKEHLQALTVRRSDDLLVLDGERFCDLHVSLQRRVLRIGAHEVEGEDGAANDVSSRKIEDAREWIVLGERRRVWQWTSRLRVEWCGAGSGNRIRLARVELGDNQ